MKKILLKHGMCMLPEGLQRVDICLADGKILKIKDDISVDELGKDGEVELIDLQGKHVLPGLIDVHVHLREPGLTNKEDLNTGTLAAAAGGVTTVLEMPNTIPPTCTKQTLEEKQLLVKEKANVNVYLYALGVPETIDEMLASKEVIGIKIYLGASTGGHEADYDFLESVLSRSAEKIVVVHAEDGDCLKRNENLFEGQKADPAVHSKIRAKECAYLAVKHACVLAKKYNARLHVAHVTCIEELEILHEFKSDRITCEVTPHHLFLDTSCYDSLGNKAKVNPPLRDKADIVALWQAVNSGLIDVVATDHAPHTLAEKALPYAGAPSGVPGLETMLPLLLNEVNAERMSLDQVVKLTSTKPALMFGFAQKGWIKEGYDADLVVVDMSKEQVVDAKNLKTKCGWSPFEGRLLKGWPVMTFVASRLV